MNRFEYLDALRDALYGMPETAVSAIVADYEHRFGERSIAGQSEEEIMTSLGDPQKVAAEKRAAFRPELPEKKKDFVYLVRLFFSLIGLSLFNLFMLVPSILYASLLFIGYVVSLAFYGAGILVTAASLAGIGSAAEPAPFEHTKVYMDGSSGTLHTASISSPASPAIAASGAKSDAGKDPGKSAGNSTNAGANAVAKSQAGSASTTVSLHNNDGSSVEVNDSGIYIDDFDDEDLPRVFHLGRGLLSVSRPVLVAFGLSMVLGSILLFLLCLVVSKMSWIGLHRLAQMEFAVLKNA
jgi:uncharacterized membrane protein